MNRNALITGVSSGIGKGLTKEYLKQGVSVYGMSRRSAEDISTAGFKFRGIDLAKLEEIPEALKELLAGVECLDLVVLNAGILGQIADLEETSVREMQEVMQVNLWANKALLDALFAMPMPVSQVVAISSGAAVSASRGWNAYSISKAALNMLMGLYAAERPETHFCALAPGIVDTPMQDQISEVPNDGRFQTVEHLRMAKGTPMMPKPEEAARQIVEGIGKATKYPSGSFLDVRTLGKRA